MKWVVAFLLIVLVPTEPPKWICVRWAWTGDVFNRKVYCLKWERVNK